METYSREMLQSLSTKEVQIERGIREHVTNTINRIVKQVVLNATHGGTSSCAKESYTNIGVPYSIPVSGWDGRTPVCFGARSYYQAGRDIVDDVLVGLRERLPGCDFQVDPLKTYILIQWG